MDCVCGAVMKDKEAVSKKNDVKWEYQECASCGRIYSQLLTNYSGSQEKARGMAAQMLFKNITGRDS